MESSSCAIMGPNKGVTMIYYVKTGELDTSVKATSHREAAVMAIKGSNKGLGELVMVNEREMSEEMLDDSMFFLTDDILGDCSMRLVS